MYNIRSIV